MTTTGEVLKPCPCCGGNAFYQQEDSPQNWWVGCEKNGCVSTDTHIERSDAIAAWNRRAPQGNAAQEWLPIESAPENGEYLVYMPQERKKYQVMYAHPNVNLIGNCFAFDMTKPSHWKPLPAAPSNKEVER